MVTKVAEGVFWVGAVDWGIRRFHGHELSTHRGTTYNAYLIVDKEVALVDTVWEPFSEELLRNIREVVDPAKITYVVANHAEVDHSGGLPAVMRECPDATVVVSKRGAESIPGHFHAGWKLRPVSTGEKIGLGSSDLVFVEAPMLHWPDSMFTYLTGRNMLMPNDAFGQHYATAFRFNNEVAQDELYEEALKYYANILTPFSDLVAKKIDEVLGLGLPVDVIAPSHGVIWRKDPLQIVKKYQEWAAQKPEPRAVVLYDTMWNATRKMADAMGEGLAEGGVDAKVFHVATADRNDVNVEVFRSRGVVVGSPTFNNGVLPTMAPVLEDLRGLKFRNKIGAAFGSYGWSGEAPKRIEEHLRSCKFEIAADTVKCKWQPAEDDLKACRDLGRHLGEAVKSKE